MTRSANTDDYVEGVVDLRGQITTILNPKEMMDIESDGSENLIVVFDAGVFEEQGAMGWIVDEVRQVVPVAESEVTPPQSTAITSTVSSTATAKTNSHLDRTRRRARERNRGRRGLTRRSTVVAVFLLVLYLAGKIQFLADEVDGILDGTHRSR